MEAFNKNIMKKERDLSLDIIRIIAIIMVLYNHKDVYTWYLRYDTFGLKFFITSALAILCKAGPPLFLMVSGYLLLQKEEEIVQIFKHRIVRMFIVLVWIATSMYIFNMIDSWKSALFSQANWYIYSYIGYLLMLPILRMVVKNAEDAIGKYYLIVVALVYSIIGILLVFSKQQSFTKYMPLFATDWAPYCWNIIFPVSAVFLYRLGQGENKEKISVCLRVGTAGTLIVASYLLYYDVRNNGGANLESIIQHSIIFPTWDIFYSLTSKKIRIESNKIANLVSNLSKNTFGMYIIEISTPLSPIYINMLVNKNELLCGTFINWIIAIVIEFVLYNVMILGLRKMPFVKRIL